MTQIILEVPLGVHHESTDPCYSGFVEVTQCSDCKAIQDYWSNNSGICKYCGGILRSNGVGRWDKQTKQWQIRPTVYRNW